MTPPSSWHMSVYMAWPPARVARSLVIRRWRQTSAPAPSTTRRPICEMSNSPATFRTAKCSSRMDVYCCGSSQPPKSTIRPPRTRWREYSGVRLGALPVKFGELVVIDDFDSVGVDEREQLVVVPAACLGHHLGDVARAI